MRIPQKTTGQTDRVHIQASSDLDGNVKGRLSETNTPSSLTVRPHFVLQRLISQPPLIDDLVCLIPPLVHFFVLARGPRHVVSYETDFVKHFPRSSCCIFETISGLTVSCPELLGVVSL